MINPYIKKYVLQILKENKTKISLVSTTFFSVKASNDRLQQFKRTVTLNMPPRVPRSRASQWHPVFQKEIHSSISCWKKLNNNTLQIKKKNKTEYTLSCCIWDFSWLPSLLVTEHEITGLVTPHARPSACFEGTNTYGTFYKTQRQYWFTLLRREREEKVVLILLWSESSRDVSCLKFRRKERKGRILLIYH